MRQMTGLCTGIMAYCGNNSCLLQSIQFNPVYKREEAMPQNKAYSARRKQPQSKNGKLPIFLLIGGGLLLLVAVFFAFQKKPAPFTPVVTGGPSLKVDKELVDLGNKKLGSTTDASFKITNVGDQPLVFSKAPYIEVIEGC